MEYQDVYDFVDMLLEHGIDTQVLTRLSCDDGEFLLLEASPTCTVPSLSALADDICHVLKFRKVSITQVEAGINLHGEPLPLPGAVRNMSYKDFMGLEKGRHVVCLKSFEIHYTVFYSGPGSGGGMVSIPAGAEFELAGPRNDEELYCRATDRAVVDLARQDVIDHLGDWARKRISSISFYLVKSDFDLGFIREL